MDERNDMMLRHDPASKQRERLLGGLLLVLIGGVLLARQMGVPLPGWLFTWPMIPLLVGLFIGIKVRFRNLSWIIPTLVGVVFLADQITPNLNLRPFIVPLIIIAIGLLFIFRPRSKAWSSCNQMNRDADTNATADMRAEGATYMHDRSDLVDTTSVFGGVKKIVLSKNFRGGEIINFMGGSEIDLTQADFNGRIHIETTNVFGGTKLVVPAHWDVQSDVVAIFGGVDDKRRRNGAALDPQKVVVLDGTCLFGGIEISSY